MSDEPRPIGNGLDRIMRSLRGTSAASQVGVFAGWAEAVGPVVAAHARPASLDDGLLIVDRTDPGSRKEALAKLRPRLLLAPR